MRRAGCMLAVLVVAAAFTFGCGCLTGEEPAQQNRLAAEGTVVFVPEEGGFFGIVADDGNRYRPANLEDQYKIHGQRVRFSAEIRPEILTLSQWGTPVEIISIERIAGGLPSGTGNLSAPSGTAAAPGIVTIFGQVVSVDDEYYAIVADDGTMYYPLNLADEFRQEGTSVVVEGEIAALPADAGDRGIPITILEIAEVSE
jgi:hypothetical protein